MQYFEIHNKLMEIANPQHAINLQRFFKTGKGDYGEGDIFLGIRNPEIRDLVKLFFKVELDVIIKMLASKYHEERMLSLLILVKKFSKADENGKAKIFNLYISNTKYINNWDLVDLTAPNIIGAYLANKDKDLLFQFANTNNLWEKRISIISTAAFIRANYFDTTFQISELLLHDKYDLIHKAVGWMLREIGKREIDAELMFLNAYYKDMPRTMLRYAIEKFPEELRLSYLKGKI